MYAEAAGGPWLILSAKYGLLDPEKVVAPYDVALADLPANARREWGERVVEALQARFGSLTGMTFELHAGTAYRAAITPKLHELGAKVEQPLVGLPMGRQLGWYRGHGSARATRASQTGRRSEATHAEVTRALGALDGQPRRLAAIDWPADLRDLDQPGLYSWWVDADGARTLTLGLGQTIERGRIYAGQTGATKWPSGKAGAMTLGKRIGGSHLNGRVRSSPFRLTLAAIIASPERLTPIEPSRLNRESERHLSEWMRTHLHVAVHPFSDRDVLQNLEKHVLDELDPPLNLEGRPATTIRLKLTELTELRRQLAASTPRAPTPSTPVRVSD